MNIIKVIRKIRSILRRRKFVRVLKDWIIVTYRFMKKDFMKSSANFNQLYRLLKKEVM